VENGAPVRHERDTRAWRRTRSSHARVLEALEASIAAHPASGRREQGRPGTTAPAGGDEDTGAVATVTPIRGATVLRFVPRSERSGPPDAA
jgi:hypothetical protein